MADYESKIANVQSEAEQIISDAKDNAKVEYGKIISRAEVDTARMKKEAQKQIDAEKESARAAAKEEIASLAMQAAEKVVGANVDDKTNNNILNEFLNESSVDLCFKKLMNMLLHCLKQMSLQTTLIKPTRLSKQPPRSAKFLIIPQFHTMKRRQP